MKKRIIKATPILIISLIIIFLSSIVGVLIPISVSALVEEVRLINFLSPIVLTIILFILQAIMVAVGHTMMARDGDYQIKHMRNSFMNRLLHAPKAFFDLNSPSELANRIINDTNHIQQFITQSLPTFISSIVTVVGTLIALLFLDWQLTSILLISLPLVAIPLIPLTKLSSRYSIRQQNSLSRLSSLILEYLQNMSLIKSSVAEEFAYKEVQGYTEDLRHISSKNTTLYAVVQPIGLLLIFGSIALIFSYGGLRVNQGTLSVGTLISFLIYLFQLINPLGSFSGFFAQKGKMEGAIQKLSKIQDIEVENLDEGKLFNYGEINFIDVSFGYPKINTNSEELIVNMKSIYSDELNLMPILEGVSMTFKEGEKTAIVGPSGGGKSTILNLLMQFYPIKNGKIISKENEIDSFKLSDWRDNISIVSQDISILSGTIRENLVFGLDYSPSENQIQYAIRFAHLEETIAKLHDGLETVVGEAGSRLSGGQKQRIHIARAVLRDTPILLLDEATSNLDADAEYQINQSLQRLMGSKTTIGVAHRLSTIMDADNIYFIDNKKVTGSGTHSELLKTHALYARFVKEQLLSNE